LWSDGENWFWRVPPEGVVPFTVEALIEQMISSLVDAGQHRDVLEARALIPHQMAAPFLMWSKLTDLTVESLKTIVDSFVQDGLLHENDFAHPLIREVILHSLSPNRRRELARKVLDDLEATNLELAARYVTDAQLSPQEAYNVLQKAIAQAVQKKDSRLEAHWLVQAVEYAPADQRASLAIRAAGAIKLFDVRQAIRLASIGVQVNPFDAKAVFTLAKLKATLGERFEMEQLVMSLPEASRESEYGLKQHLIARANTDDTAGAYALWQKLQEHGYALDTEIINQVIQTLYLHGDTELALQLATQAFSSFELPAAQQAMLLIDYSARSLFERGEYTQAEDQITKAVELLRTQTDPRVLALAIGNRGIVRGSLGRASEAIEDFKEAAKLFADIGLTLKYAECLENLGTTYGNIGRFSEAEMVLLEARDILRNSQLSKDLCSCENSLATLYANWMPPYGKSLTLKHARAALEVARGIQNPALLTHYLSTASRAEASHGDAKKALEHAQELMAIANKLENPRISKQAFHAYGIALDANGQPEQAVSALTQAIQVERDAGSAELLDTLELEIDRITHNLESVRIKIERFKRDGEGMLLTLAERYFPELSEGQADQSKSAAPAAVQLLVLGEISVLHQAQAIKYRGRKRLEFLLYLLETRISGRGEAHTLEMIDALYPELSEAEAKAALKQLVYLVRHQLGSEVIQSTPNGYALGAVSSDLEQFLASGEASLWRGTYLQGFGEGWLQGVRDAVVHALQSRVEVLAETDPNQAVRLGKILLEMEPYDLEALELTLQALVASNENPKRIYLEMRQKLLEVGEMLPETAQAFLERREVSLARV
jgi:tetratricopeptide (TPR) repeat protein